MKKIIFILLLSALSLPTKAQQNGGRWELGGSFGFGFGDSQTSLNVSPQVGYRLTNYLTVGGGPSYAYYKYKHLDIKSNYLGLNAFARLHPIQYLQVFVQPEIFRRWGKIGNVKDVEKTFGALLVGGGVLIPVVRGGILVSVYYDVIQNDYSPYKDDLMYSVGYTFYF